MPALTTCPKCGFDSPELRCPRCNALKVIACTGACSLCVSRGGCPSADGAAEKTVTSPEPRGAGRRHSIGRAGR